MPCTLHKLPGKSSLNVRSVCPGFPGFPVCPDDHDGHDGHDYNDNHNHDDLFCTFTFWQQRQQIEFCQMFWSLTFDRNFSINDRHFPIRKRFDKI